MAQFNHPQLGGMGQWTRGGMLMIGDMLDGASKARVLSLAEDLSGAAVSGDVPDRPPRHDAAASRSSTASEGWWPTELGQPSSSGPQNGSRYAVFPNLRRLAVERGGRTSVYDTGDLRIGGASQHQSSRPDLVFATQNGSVRAEDLPTV